MAAALVYVLLPAAGSQAAAADSIPLPPLHMHVFSADTKSPAKRHARPDSAHGPALHMVVFNEQTKPAAAVSLSKDKPVQPRPAFTEPESKTDHVKGFQTAVYLRPGYRIDDIRWNIAAPGGTPNILSELSWDNLQSAQLKTGFRIDSPWNIALLGSAAYGQIFSGKNQDSDYFGDNRTLEFSRSNNRTDAGNTLDLSSGIGYRFAFREAAKSNPWLSITPLFGYSYHKQRLKITDGVQTIPAFGPFPGLDSRYNTTWRGPWIGFDTAIVATDNLDFFAGLEYHWISYEAEANWNLRSDFQHPVSFRHKADGHGVTVSAGGRYHFSELFSLSLSLDYQHWLANKNGVDTTFTTAYGVLTTRFNEVKWNAFGVNLGMQFSF